MHTALDSIPCFARQALEAAQYPNLIERKLIV
jgi:hypothetical protein